MHPVRAASTVLGFYHVRTEKMGATRQSSGYGCIMSNSERHLNNAE